MPALPLQLLALEHPEWSDRPLAVVDRDRPTGQILWVNERAYRSRVLPGLRYAAGLALCRQLCAGEVHPDEIARGAQQIAELLQRFSPEVEGGTPGTDNGDTRRGKPDAASPEPGVFWLDATGMEPLEASLQSWGERLHGELTAAGFVASIAIGFSRFGSYALARSQTHAPVVVLESPIEEERSVRKIRLDRLQLDPNLRAKLGKLGIHTVGAFLKLPPTGLGKRFGAAAVRLHRAAAGALVEPLVPIPPSDPVEVWVELEYPEADAIRLLFVIKRVLHSLLESTVARGQALTELNMKLSFDSGDHRSIEIRTAAPTLDNAQILELVRLRFERFNIHQLDLSAGVTEMLLTARGVPVSQEQLELFVEQPRRDLAAANRAFARLRTRYGRDAVARAQLRDGHLPEATYTWESLEKAQMPAPKSRNSVSSSESDGASLQRPMVRRVYRRPIALPHRENQEQDGWLVRGPEQGPMVRIVGPYVVSGGWWVREVFREYHFVETQKGDVMWVYYDRVRRRWFLQGVID